MRTKMWYNWLIVGLNGSGYADAESGMTVGNGQIMRSSRL